MQQPLYALLAATKSQDAFVTGRKSGITTAVRLRTASTPLEKGVLIVAPSGNAGTVYVGTSASLTADADDTTDGFPLVAGSGVFVPVNDLNKVWLLSGSGTNKVFFHAA